MRRVCRHRVCIAAWAGEFLVELRVCAVCWSESCGSDNRGSVLRLQFQAPDRTLTDPEVGEIQDCWTPAVHTITGLALWN